MCTYKLIEHIIFELVSYDVQLDQIKRISIVIYGAISFVTFVPLTT